MKTKDRLKVLKDLCKELGIPLVDESKEVEAEQKKYARAIKYANGNTFQNPGLYFMNKLKFTRWKGEEKQNLIRLFQRQRALFQRRKKH